MAEDSATKLCEAIAVVEAFPSPLSPDVQECRDFLYEMLDQLLPPPVHYGRAERRGVSGFALAALQAQAEAWSSADAN
mgnify:CR=1 FL=1